MSISYPTTVPAPANAQAPTTVTTSSTDTVVGGLLPPATTSGVAVNSAAACYASGTLIRIERGGVIADVAVEDLCVGDRAVTASGEHRPIRWIGHRRTDCRNHPRPCEVMPVRIAAHAFGGDRPARALRVSPGHSSCIDVLGEVLIPASALINGITIQQVEVETVTYWHVELDDHDIILAENLACESYLEMDGTRVEAVTRGLIARFPVPAAARDV